MAPLMPPQPIDVLLPTRHDCCAMPPLLFVCRDSARAASARCQPPLAYALLPAARQLLALPPAMPRDAMHALRYAVMPRCRRCLLP
jgi:hypothetical protein